MTPRIMGVETEYGVSFTVDGARRLSSDEAARAMFRDIVAAHRTSNVFTANGGRLYLDVGNHPEYATAECTDLHDVLAQDRAGELMMDQLATAAVEYLESQEIKGTMRVLKNNIDSAGNSYGCHENYMVSRSNRLDVLSRALVPFLVTRQIMCGAGHITRRAPGEDAPPRFAISQRADVMWEGVSSATTRSRPMINSRDEPHADANKHRRLHVIVGDSNMSQTTTLLKLGSTELLLRLLETGGPTPTAALASESTAIRSISLDPDKPITLADGTTATAVQIQRAHFEAVQAHTEAEGFPGRRDHDVLALWDRVLTALENDDTDVLERDVDWAIKRRVMRRLMERHGAGIEDPRVAALDLLFHDVRRGQGMFARLEEAGAVSRVLTPEAEEQALTTPPPTRAAIRGRFVEKATQADVPFSVDWSHVRTLKPVERTIELLDPFASADARVDALLNQISAAKDS